MKRAIDGRLRNHVHPTGGQKQMVKIEVWSYVNGHTWSYLNDEYFERETHKIFIDRHVEGCTTIFAGVFNKP